MLGLDQGIKYLGFNLKTTDYNYAFESSCIIKLKPESPYGVIDDDQGKPD
jgi:hypothetical protein